MDFSEKWGKDVEEATRLALLDLQLTEKQVTVIVLEEPTKGFLGLGAKLAKVRVVKNSESKTVINKEKNEKQETSYIDDKSRGQVSESRREPEVRREARSEDRPERRERRNDRPRQTGDTSFEGSFSLRERPTDLTVIENHAAEVFLKEITEKMGLELQISIQGNEACLYIEMEGKDSGTIIGKRGQTLDAMQYLTSLVVNKDKDKYQRVILDAEHYREKREKTIELLANRLAEKVIKSRRSVKLEPMNPYERKVIHATLQSNPNVTTRSEGEEPFRRVIIELK